MKEILIGGAKQNNLKSIDVSIPKNSIVVITGVSGSGKSSLAFDIVAQEGYRRYLKSLGMITDTEEESRFDHISGLGPTIGIKQSVTRQSNPHSTIGTRTGIIRKLAILYSTIGDMGCSICGNGIGNKDICVSCGDIQERLTSNFFMYNSPEGMCTACLGKGSYNSIDMNQLVTSKHTNLYQIIDRIKPTPGYRKLMMKRYHEYLEMPFFDIPKKRRIEILYGRYVETNRQNQSYCIEKILQMGIQKKDPDIEKIYKLVHCEDCSGYRIGDEARAVTINDMHIGQVCISSIEELKQWLDRLSTRDYTPQIKGIIEDLNQQANSLIDARLGYLSLYRRISTLSGGELQRLLLQSHLTGQLDSIIYVLDEPTSGLHPREKSAIIQLLKDLKKLGNTVIVVEHDKRIMEIADYIIEIGPKAGIQGGDLVYRGDYEGLLMCKESLISPYLNGSKDLPHVEERQGSKDIIRLKNCSINNLRGFDIEIPLCGLVGISGVSGSGKSSIVEEIKKQLSHSHNKGLDEYIVVDVAQQPIGRKSTSMVASYIGIWDNIRRLFAKASGDEEVSVGDFSFNSKGACQGCGGSGIVKHWLGGNNFITSTCKECGGNRFNDDTLKLKYRNRSILDVLNLSITEARMFFSDVTSISTTLDVLEDIGMGYMKLGQPANTLSGGEGQRIKLAKYIGKRRTNRKYIYILDEPTIGLGLYDTELLLLLLNKIIKMGSHIIIVEHSVEMISRCSWVIELGPGSGLDGGRVVSAGRPIPGHLTHNTALPKGGSCDGKISV